MTSRQKSKRPRRAPRPKRVTKSPPETRAGSLAARAAVVYVRVSTPRQAEEGDSLAAQQAAGKRFAAERGLRVAAYFDDAGKSGRTTKGRTGLEQAIAKAQATKGLLIVRSLSRLARSVIDLHEILRQLHHAGADLASINEALDTSTAAGRAFFGFVAVMAQFESDLIAERTREAYRHRAAIGRPILAGVPRFGTRVVRGKLVADERAGKIIALIRLLRKRGKSYKQIAAELNRRGLKTGDQMYGRKRQGIRHAKWWPSTVQRLVKRAEAEPRPVKRQANCRNGSRR
ncbi:MAG: recombinase family protein [Pseudomonadota bacterium]|nr:recombinase family protein [Pseudomonadota bacterium]